MTEKTLEALPKRSSTVAKCEKHGLHYDSGTMSGCVLCRREAAGGAAGPRASAEAQSGSLGPALLVTLILLVLTTGAFYFAHSMVARNFKTWLPGGEEETAIDGGFESKMDDLGVPADAAEPVDTYSGSED